MVADIFTFSLAIMANKQMFKALVMVELLNSEEEEETKGWGITKSWLNKREELGYFTNIVRELQLEDTGGIKEMMRIASKHFNDILNLIASDITIFFLNVGPACWMRAKTYPTSSSVKKS